MTLYGDKLSFRETIAVVITAVSYTTMIVTCVGLSWWWLQNALADPGNDLGPELLTSESVATPKQIKAN